MSTPPRILAIDDDAAIAEMVSILLEGRGYSVVTAPDARKGLAILERENIDLVLLDLMLPGMDGIEICRNIRESSNVPIIMLTARTETEKVVEGLEVGADDYLTKPFEPEELVARIRARVRRAPHGEAEILKLGDLEINVDRRQVLRNGETIRLTPIELGLLIQMTRNPSQVFSREDLLREVWGYQHSKDTRLVNVHVQRLRSKIEIDPDNPRLIVTVRGVGYRAGE
ncbi:MtrAB system response regulator MtrA [Dermabacter sp. HSID17554]|uniref:MtrAB system response regulator MtrA n=1 Tax=Dermabacter sp. HSID17554 TaxID=2419511 RepID=UPI000F87464A|nr:MtrAB system response regulator MtrA [Dermabacter sp. HSID17554]RUP87521.1 DNA-binding response regulator [Dermabacter sp. HSID17554]